VRPRRTELIAGAELSAHGSELSARIRRAGYLGGTLGDLMDMSQSLSKCRDNLTDCSKPPAGSKRVSSARTSLWFLVVLLAALLPGGVFGEATVEAASNIIIVNIADDTNTPGDGSCSLREAINNANSIGVDTTNGDCTVGTGPDIVNFDTHNFRPDQYLIEQRSPFPAISHNLTIDGANQNVIDGLVQNVGNRRVVPFGQLRGHSLLGQFQYRRRL